MTLMELWSSIARPACVDVVVAALVIACWLPRSEVCALCLFSRRCPSTDFNVRAFVLVVRKDDWSKL